MANEKKRFTLEEWRTEGLRRFGENEMTWAFVCPVCKHRQTVQNYKDAGAPQGAVAFSCVGRWLPGGPEGQPPKKAFPWEEGKGPCDYAGGGLFGLNPVIVLDANGVERNIFAFAEPEPETADATQPG